MLAAVALSLCLATAARAAGEEELERAERLVDGLRYDEAGRALEAARAARGNGRATLLRILELQGIVAASTGRMEQARSAFRLLVVLSPGHTLKGKYPPKVTAPFYEAKGWATEQAPLRFQAGWAEEGGGTLVARVEGDPLGVGRRVRFHLQEEGAEPRELELALEEGGARTQGVGAQVRWRAELLGDRDEVLAERSSEDAPATAARAAVEPPPLAPAVAAPPQPGGQGLAFTPRTLSYASLGGAGVALGAGAIFGLRSREARGRIESAARDELGRVIGLTQREAEALDARARTEAVVANVLFGTAGALGVAGAVLWWRSSAPVAVIPAGPGVAVVGVLP